MFGALSRYIIVMATSVHAAVYEPTPEELELFNTLSDVFEWAKIRGLKFDLE